MPAKKAAKKAAAKKAAVKTVATKKAPAKKAAAKKAPAKKAAAKKAAAKKTAASAAGIPHAAVRRPRKARQGTKQEDAAATSEAINFAKMAAKFAADMKAEDVKVLDVSHVSSITDAFVICTGTALPHLRAIAREIRDGVLEASDLPRPRLDGQAESGWLVLDFGLFMCHIFLRDQREHFDLESVWSDAKIVELD